MGSGNPAALPGTVTLPQAELWFGRPKWGSALGYVLTEIHVTQMERESSQWVWQREEAPKRLLLGTGIYTCTEQRGPLEWKGLHLLTRAELEGQGRSSAWGLFSSTQTSWHPRVFIECKSALREDVMILVTCVEVGYSQVLTWTKKHGSGINVEPQAVCCTYLRCPPRSQMF